MSTKRKKTNEWKTMATPMIKANKNIGEVIKNEGNWRWNLDQTYKERWCMCRKVFSVQGNGKVEVGFESQGRSREMTGVRQSEKLGKGVQCKIDGKS